MTPEQRQSSRPGQNFMDHARETLSGAYEQTEDLVRQNPATSAIVTFGLGFCVGMFLTSMLATPQRGQSWYESYLPEGMSPKQMKDTMAQYMSTVLNKVRG